MSGSGKALLFVLNAHHATANEYLRSMHKFVDISCIPFVFCDDVAILSSGLSAVWLQPVPNLLVNCMCTGRQKTSGLELHLSPIECHGEGCTKGTFLPVGSELLHKLVACRCAVMHVASKGLRQGRVLSLYRAIGKGRIVASVRAQRFVQTNLSERVFQ